MSLTADDAKSIIDKLFNDRAKEGANTRTAAQMLTSVIADSLSGGQYTGELPQNADDAKATEIAFTLIGNYLIFSHNGNHFDKKDIEGIADAANSDRLKISQSDQIGNKGIGFKSVFSLASEISILSGEVRFRFDKNYSQWRDHPERYPWQIIPIYTELSYFPEHIQRVCAQENVNFVFKLKPELDDEIQKQLKKLRARHFLFLRYVKTCHIVDLNGRKRTLRLQQPIVKFQKDGATIEQVSINETYTWWVYHKACTLPQALQQQLAKEDAIPSKYKTWQSMRISLAILEKNGALVPVTTEPMVFCYLATNLNFGLKMVVHAEFLLDSARSLLREDSIGKAWNGFILRCMVTEQVKFLNMLATATPLWQNVFQILTDNYQVPDHYSQQCQNSFKTAIAKHPLVLNMLKDGLYTCASTIIDTLGFIAKFGDRLLKTKTVHPEIKDLSVIQKLGARSFQLSDITQYFNLKVFSELMLNPEKNKEFIEWITIIISRLNSAGRDLLEKQFKSARLILDSHNTLKRPSEIFFPNETLKYATKNFDFIPLIHPVLIKSDLSWLRRIGINTLTLEHLVVEVNKKAALLISFGLSLAHRMHKFSEADWNHLKSLKIKVSNGDCVPATEAYLPDIFSPKQALECYFSNDNSLICHADYAAVEDEAKRTVIKNFLLKIGVQQTLRKSLLMKVIVTANKSNSTEKLVALTRFFHRHYAAKTIPANLRSLNIVCTDGETHAAQTVYLADAYEPEMPLQTLIPDLPFVSEAYGDDSVALSELSSFFVAIGVQQAISVKLHYNPNRNMLMNTIPSARDYCVYLEKKYYFAPTSTTYRYSASRELQGIYVEISFIDSILSHAIFWQVLLKNWKKFSDNLNETEYGVGGSRRKVVSNIHYLVERALQHAHGQNARVDQFFCPAFASNLDGFFEGFHVAQVSASLSIEQATTLGFRSTLTVEEIQTLLKKIAVANQPRRDFNKVVFLYQCLVSALENEETPTLQPDLLVLTRDHQFKPLAELFHIIGDHLTDSRNSRLIKKPNTLSDELFVKICEFFNIHCLQHSELSLHLTGQQDSTLLTLLNARLNFIVCAVALAQDWSPEAHKMNYVQLIQKLREKLLLLTFYCANIIEIFFDDFLRERQDCWIDREYNRIYHVPYEQLDHQHIQLLWMYCSEVLALEDYQVQFISIMTSPDSKLHACYEEQLSQVSWPDLLNAAQTRIAEPPQIITLQPTAINKKRKSPPGMESIDTESSDAESSDTEQKPHCSYTAASSSSHSSSSFHGSLPPTKKARLSETPALSSSTRLRGGFFSEHLSKAQRKELGRQGEQHVYDFLKATHIKKHGEGAITENEQGYVIQKTNGDYKTIHWLNKNSEQYKPYDFEITTRNVAGEEKLRHLEVKTTTRSGNEIEVTYSTYEWQQMQTDSSTINKSHRLFVVTATIDAGDATFSTPIKIDVADETKVTAIDMKKLVIKLH